MTPRIIEGRRWHFVKSRLIDLRKLAHVMEAVSEGAGFDGESRRAALKLSITQIK
jgi:hypothetical protein